MSETTAENATLDAAAKLHEQGLALARQRRFDEAAELFQATIKADPDRVEAIRHLAQAYADADQLADAEAAWVRYITRCPDVAEAHRHLGNLRKRMDKLDLAIESLQKAVSLDAKCATFQVDLGNALTQAKRWPDAKQAFLRALELQADNFDAHTNLGMLLQEIKEGKEALEYLHKAIDLRPDDPSGHNNLGVALSEQGQFAEAIACYEKLLAKTPDYFLGWNNYGNALRSAGRNEEAMAALQRALELKPDYTEAYNNQGIIHAQMEEFAQAVHAYDQALLLRPDYPEAHANRGLVHLLMGDFQQGWADYEWRWQGNHGLRRRKYIGKQWDGSPLAGKRIVLHYEQGLGDTFQFIRYAKELKARGATVVFECQPNTRQILGHTPGIDQYVIRGEKPPTGDFYAPLLSLPSLCQTNLDNLPRSVPYIFTDPALMWEWKQRLAKVAGFRVGIVWQGNPEHKGDRNRSIPLVRFAALAAVPGVTLITLQKNFGIEQIEKLDGLFNLVDFKDVGENVDGWLRTAAIIANLDLVICADTSVGHLAGAMGVPVWMALPTSPDWRWLLNREDTPWYPTMRLFRQAAARDWEELFGRIAEALRQRLSLAGNMDRQTAAVPDRNEIQTLLRKADEHIDRQELTQAQTLLEQAVRLDPTNSSAHQDLGVTYAKQGQLPKAMACFRRALEVAPDSCGLYANLGLACYQAGQIEEAVSHLRKAIWLGASSADTYKNLARALTALPDPAGAEECYWAALKLQPDDADAHYHLARVLLMQGKVEQGWLEYEWRWRWHKQPKRHNDRPRWTGQKLDGKRILFVAEQDPRDTIQLIRYADVLAQEGGQVVLECQPALTKLMRACLGVEQVVPVGNPPVQHDYQIAMLSLPAARGTTLNTIPAARPYIGVDTATLKLWQHRLQDLGKVKIALALEEHGQFNNAAQPSPLQQAILRRLSRLSDVTFMDLHAKVATKPAEHGKTKPLPRSFALDDWDESDQVDRLVAVAAVLRNVDLLIALDNVTAHIAGASGVPTWVALPISPDPRWMLKREDSPWYPTVRLFRQRHHGDWDEVASRIALALEQNITR